MNFVLGIVALCVILLALSVHFLLFPYLLMLVLGFFGYEVSFLISMGLWLITYTILSIIFKRGQGNGISIQ